MFTQMEVTSKPTLSHLVFWQSLPAERGKKKFSFKTNKERKKKFLVIFLIWSRLFLYLHFQFFYFRFPLFGTSHEATFLHQLALQGRRARAIQQCASAVGKNPAVEGRTCCFLAVLQGTQLSDVNVRRLALVGLFVGKLLLFFVLVIHNGSRFVFVLTFFFYINLFWEPSNRKICVRIHPRMVRLLLLG